MNNNPQAEILLAESKVQAELEKEFNKLRPKPFGLIFIIIIGSIWVGFISGRFLGVENGAHQYAPYAIFGLLIFIYGIYSSVNKRIDVMYKLLLKTKHASTV